MSYIIDVTKIKVTAFPKLGKKDHIRVLDLGVYPFPLIKNVFAALKRTGVKRATLTLDRSRIGSLVITYEIGKAKGTMRLLLTNEETKHAFNPAVLAS